MTLGLRRAGFEVVGAVEIDQLAAETYRANHPETWLVNEDINNVDADSFAEATLGRRKNIDLLAACPPCQGFSSVRTLRGRTSSRDPRNRLILRVLRFVDALRPRAILFENVPGLCDDWRFTAFRSELRRRGYYIDFHIADAANYGVPQRRRRLFLAASIVGPVRLPVAVAPKRTVKAALAKLQPAGFSGDPLHDYAVTRSPIITNLIKRIPKDGGSRGSLGAEHQLPCHLKNSGFHDVYGRLSWNDVAPTITGGCINPSKGRFLHPEENRAITLREAALLQSFPRNYKFSLRRGRYAAAEMIGNAFPPLVVQKQAVEIRRLLSR